MSPPIEILLRFAASALPERLIGFQICVRGIPVNSAPETFQLRCLRPSIGINNGV
ncbi:hypothetical protein SUNI508_08738 [Seiridium unicorne]|uniref:Uncharacterized protein n=1 Tax=Seiridium unicorne TaxID=138068 RepID=A0ABR2URT7_9PEZI